MLYLNVKELGELARKLRLRAGLSQAQIADMIGTTQSNVSAAENGRGTRYSKIALKIILELANCDVSGPYYCIERGEIDEY